MLQNDLKTNVHVHTYKYMYTIRVIKNIGEISCIYLMRSIDPWEFLRNANNNNKKEINAIHNKRTTSFG